MKKYDENNTTRFLEFERDGSEQAFLEIKDEDGETIIFAEYYSEEFNNGDGPELAFYGILSTELSPEEFLFFVYGAEGYKEKDIENLKEEETENGFNLSPSEFIDDLLTAEENQDFLEFWDECEAEYRDDDDDEEEEEEE